MGLGSTGVGVEAAEAQEAMEGREGVETALDSAERVAVAERVLGTRARVVAVAVAVEVAQLVVGMMVAKTAEAMKAAVAARLHPQSSPDHLR